MMELRTDRLILEPVGEQTDPEEVLPIFNSNPDWIAASDSSADKTSWQRSDVEMHLWQESLRENSVSLAIRWRHTGEMVGLAALLKPHPERQVPMIGLLLIHGEWQRRGIGAETLEALEGWLVESGWNRVLATVLEACPDVRRFWEHQGFRAGETGEDQDKRHVSVLTKELA